MCLTDISEDRRNRDIKVEDYGHIDLPAREEAFGSSGAVVGFGASAIGFFSTINSK